MFKHILVPLDGSSLAEDVLGAVESFGRHLGSRVTLLHVVEQEAPKRVHGETHLGDVSEALAYLEGIAESLAEAGIEVETHVHERSVADVPAAIDAHAHEYDADLIAMCKHGRSGIRQRLVGSIAQHILRGGGTPMLLRTPRSSGERSPFELNDVLVPIDFEHNTSAQETAACPQQGYQGFNGGQYAFPAENQPSQYGGTWPCRRARAGSCRSRSSPAASCAAPSWKS